MDIKHGKVRLSIHLAALTLVVKRSRENELTFSERVNGRPKVERNL